MSVLQAANVLGASYAGPDVSFRGVSTDTRTLVKAQMYCALKGPNFDGHDFASVAVEKGAVCVVGEKALNVEVPEIIVANSTLALGELARAWRRRFELPVVGITGSSGKTTVKEMVASILEVEGRVLSTSGNLNNEIGVPQTLFGLADEYDFAVIEMGANHVGEIARLAAIAEPDVAIITLCAPSHLEGFGSIDNVAQAKGEIYEGLGPSGTAVINADDAYAEFWCGIAQHCNVLKFGFDKHADVSAEAISAAGVGTGMTFTLRLPEGAATVSLPFDGRHNVANALGAAAAATALGIGIMSIKQGLENATKVPGRLNVVSSSSGARLIDDTYNANPASVRAAIELLASEAGQRWLIFGDMGELGPDAIDLHKEIGLFARDRGVDRFVGVGELSKYAAEAFGSGGEAYPDAASLMEAIEHEISSDHTVLVKGSRAMRMEKIVAALSEVKRTC